MRAASTGRRGAARVGGARAAALVLLAALGLLGACRLTKHTDGGAPAPYECRSLLGEPLGRFDPYPERLPELREAYTAAVAAHDADPTSEESAVWLGRRLANLGRYRDAIDAYTRGLELHPQSVRLLRHRGHRYLTLRRFAEAEADLVAAADLSFGMDDEPEPDSAPSQDGPPRSTLLSNVWYHLALVRYVQGDLERALAAWNVCLQYSRVNDDLLVAALHWRWMTLALLGRADEAAEALQPVREGMDVRDNLAYRDCLLLRKGLRTEEEVLAAAEGEIDRATRAYGVAVGRQVRGDEDGALALYREIVKGEAWPAFGHLAAEAELARRRGR